MTISELIEKVKDQDLSKDQLEHYFDMLSVLESQLHLSMAELEKKEALYLDASEEKTNADKKRKWESTPEGQKEIETKNQIRAIKPLLASIKSRIFRQIY